jgi:hypothetical protein
MKQSILIIGVALAAGATVLLAGDAVVRPAPQVSTLVSFAKAITVVSPLLYPSWLAAGDLDHSGIPGLAVVSPDNGVPLFYALGKGNGRFRLWRQDDNVGYAPSFVSLADVDGDGNLDAITTNILAGDLNVTFWDGKGHLHGGKRLLVGGVQSTYIVAVADLNGDSIPDIVGTANSGIFVIMGKGSREFAKAVTFGSGGQSPYGIAVGDLNHDGIPDLVVANNGADQPPYNYNVAVLLGKGDGTFGRPMRCHGGVRPWQLALGDFNGDGNLDLAVVPIDGKNRILVMLGKGDGTFSPPKSYRAGVAPHAIVAADFNGDGKLDLAVAAANVTILLGNGDGTFQPPIDLRAPGHHPTELVVADFNRDGKPDIGTINDDSTISIFLNTTPFPAPTPLR